MKISAEHEEQVFPLTVENTVWANTVVASGTIIGVTIYTGSDRRAAMNTSVPHTKVGLLEIELNRLSKVRSTLAHVLHLRYARLK